MLLLPAGLAAQELPRPTADLHSLLAWDHSRTDVEGNPEVIVEAEVVVTSTLEALPGAAPLAQLRGPSDGPGRIPLADLFLDLENGVYRIWARVRDNSGNWSAWSEPLEVEFVEPEPFRRADVNQDGRIDISDPVALLFAIFLGAFEIHCEDAADSNDDGLVDISDPINTLAELFLGSGEIPAPGMFGCGPDPTHDALGCASFPACP